jgi:trehalose-phosphatase
LSELPAPDPARVARRLRPRGWIALDIDGTIAALVEHPGEARVLEEAKAALDRLAERPGVELAFITGRALDDARRLVGIGGAWYAGNHGYELADPEGKREQVVSEEEVEPVRRVAARLAQPLAALPGVYLEDKHWTLSVHDRRANDSDRAIAATLIEQAVAAEPSLRAYRGHMLWEVTPCLQVHKGTALAWIQNRLGPSAALALVAGDDTTDENMIRAATAGAATVRVGPVPDGTAASFWLPGPRAFAAFLAGIANELYRTDR